MTIVAEQYRNVIGVDTHARTHAYVSIESITGRVIAEETFPTSPPGIRRAISWMDRVSSGPFLAAVEGASTYGSLLCTALREAGIPLTEARPPKRSERRVGKSDAIDAEAAARDALGQQLERLIVPRMGTQRAALRVLLAARRNIEQHHAADRCALTALVRTVDLQVDARRRLTAGQIKRIAGWRHHSGDDLERQVARVEASRLARSVIALGVELRANKQHLRELVTVIAPGLLEHAGIGPVSSAVFLAAWSHPGRVRSEAAFASLAGACPIPASSGNTIRYRLNRHGDRQLNWALDVVARSRLLHDPDTRAYATRRRAEGKTPAEIRRIIKRYIARQVHRELTSIFASAPTSGQPAVGVGGVPGRGIQEPRAKRRGEDMPSKARNAAGPDRYTHAVGGRQTA